MVEIFGTDERLGDDECWLFIPCSDTTQLGPDQYELELHFQGQDIQVLETEPRAEHIFAHMRPKQVGAAG